MFRYQIWVVLRPFSDVKRMSNHFQSTLMPMPSQSQVNQPYTNVLYYQSYLKINTKILGTCTNYKIIQMLDIVTLKTLKTIEKRWQFHGKTMALTFAPR